MKSYVDEITGQREFYSRVGINPDISHNTDGIDKGNLYENKLSIDNIGKVLFQAIKYASRIRIRGEKLPANIILNDLNAEKAYIFKSSDLLPEIEKKYFGAASRNNDDFTFLHAKYETVDYSDSQGLQKLLHAVNSGDFTKYHVNNDNIFGLSLVYYKFRQDKNGLMRGPDAEIRKPDILSDRILPYEKQNNLEFEKIMDCLNPKLLQREQGAFYTPSAYVKEMQKMLLQAIDEIPEGQDYVIIDRCAGVGNLEEGLSDDILSHCILSTIEPNEYQILNYKFSSKSSVVIPETDALAYDIIPAESGLEGQVFNDYVREKTEDPNCVIILVENPPFSEAGSGGVQKTGQKENKWKTSYVARRMKEKIEGAPTNDLANLFIWSGFEYYLKKPHDSYILFSPLKYWRNQNLVNKKFVQGFLCDRHEFHATLHSAMACIWWRNTEDTITEKLILPPYDIENDAVKIATSDITIRKAHHKLSELYDKREFPNDSTDGIICERDGSEFKKNGRKVNVIPVYNVNIIGYLATQSFLIDRKTVTLVRAALYYGHGFFLRRDNFIEKLPLFVAASYPYSKWWDTDVYSKTNDGQKAYLKDESFLKKCLIFTALSFGNKCLSLVGSDGRFYKNELCFDHDALARESIGDFELTTGERELIHSFDEIIQEAQNTEEYKKEFSYGVWQIMKEINIKIPSGRKKRNGSDIFIRKYSNLNTKLEALKRAIKKYYREEIISDLFKYSLLK